MTDRTGDTRPTPPQLQLRVTGSPGEVDLAVHRLRDAFTHIEASEPAQLMSIPELTRVTVTAVL